MKVYRFDIPMPPPEHLAGLVAGQALAAWFDSALQGHPHARFSFLVAQPLQVIAAKSEAEIAKHCTDLDQWLASQLIESNSVTPFEGGVLSFFSYEPTAYFWLVDSGIVIDHHAQHAWVFSLGLQEDLKTQDKRLAKIRCQALVAALQPSPVKSGSQIREFHAELSKEKYCEKIRQIQERILRGDCYQINFSQRFRLEGHWDAADLYLRLRGVSPAPQMAFISLGEEKIFSASPEILLEMNGDHVRSYPIKGTRPRGKTPAIDQVLAQELLHSSKDAAELLMIVDLMRNDLGRFCKMSSVSVAALKVLDSLPQVHHLYAIIAGIKRRDVGPFAALRSVFPGGSITGAPKLKAMEVIQELELSPRGIYTGSLGYAGFNGKACFNIAIRTAWLRASTLMYAAGGGIVADSIPEAEYEECLHKAEGFFRALGF